jgi:iron-sulfur cluster repair protein YtfE (RIC family)
MSFKFNNEIYSISYRYTISNGLSFPDDLLDSFPKIKFCSPEKSDLKEELKIINNQSKEISPKDKSLNEKTIRLKELSDNYSKIVDFVAISDNLLQKDDLKELIKITKKSDSFTDIQIKFFEISIKYKVNIKELFSFILKKTGRI